MMILWKEHEDIDKIQLRAFSYTKKAIIAVMAFLLFSKIERYDF